MATREIDVIKKRLGELTETEKIELISLLNKSLRKTGRPSRLLQYGKYRDSGRKLSTPEDFKIAEWHPTDSELDGDPVRS